jgi:AcrR family transcriptional regulator
MGRPRTHDIATGEALLDAAERVIAADGLGAVSVRSLSDEAGTTTRAVYSLFGSKDGLIAALGARAFDRLGAAVEAVPTTEDPAADLVEAGLAFRRLLVGHPALFLVGIQQSGTTPEQATHIRAASARAWTVLRGRVVRMQERQQLGSWRVDDAATAFHALCEGLAAVELRGLLPARTADRQWHDALTALVRGFGVPHESG